MNYQIESAIKAIDGLEDFEDVSNLLDRCLQNAQDFLSPVNSQETTDSSLDDFSLQARNEANQALATAIKLCGYKMREYRDVVLTKDTRLQLMEAEIDDLKAEKEVLANSMADLSSQVTTLQTLLDKADIETFGLGQKIRQLKNEKRNLRSSIENLEDELSEFENIRIRQPSHESVIKSQGVVLSDYKSEIYTLKEAIDSQASLIESLEAELMILHSREEKYEEESSESKEIMERLRGENQELKNQLQFSINQNVDDHKKASSPKRPSRDTLNKNKLVGNMMTKRKLQRENIGILRRNSLKNELMSCILNEDEDERVKQSEYKREYVRTFDCLDYSEEKNRDEIDQNRAQSDDLVMFVFEEASKRQHKPLSSIIQGVNQDLLIEEESQSEILLEKEILHQWDDDDFPRLQTQDSGIVSVPLLPEIRAREKQSLKTSEKRNSEPGIKQYDISEREDIKEINTSSEEISGIKKKNHFERDEAYKKQLEGIWKKEGEEAIHHYLATNKFEAIKNTNPSINTFARLTVLLLPSIISSAIQSVKDYTWRK